MIQDCSAGIPVQAAGQILLSVAWHPAQLHLGPWAVAGVHSAVALDQLHVQKELYYAVQEAEEF